MTIQILPPNVAAQIAAGEVVERPASVVKELVENALDADATQISVAIEQGGTKLIRVQDNGAGIPADQVVTAFSRHATSKLRTADDLQNIATLGFRGEALPSIAAVSQLTCVSCTADAQAAVQYRIRFGNPEQPPRPAGAANGTSLTVEDLFGNQPARLKFLRTKPTEAAHVQRVVARYAMAYPHVRFAYANDGNETFRTNGTGKLQETILSIMGHDVASKMLPVLLDADDVNVSGYVGNTDLHRSNRNDISVTVNGRWIQDSNLAYAIEQGYSNSLPMGRRPIAVIHLVVPAETVDVNAHPTKQEVRFRHESKIFAAVQRAVREALSSHGTIHQAVSRPFGPAGQRNYRRPAPDNARFDQELSIRQPADKQNQRARPMPDRGNPRPSTGRPESERRSPRQPEDPLVTTDLQAGQNLRNTILELRLIGQAQRTFILADGPNGLYVLDQHAAHERVIFDRVFRQRTGQPADSQKLMLPERTTLDEFQHETLVQHLELIEQQGFSLQHLSDLTWQINALPLPLTAPHCPKPEHALQQLLDEFAAEQIITSPQQAIAATIACHSATRAGDALSVAEMQAILDQLADTPEPHHCPHGRPTIVQIPTLRLEQEFRRR
ncbi:MAG: DNA mismatch repair endonuclease MutL [Chloroflexota bacterium]|nr:DNA mismatch repair endonuclease MutL [Chloroflexota bacterium]MDE2958602.1 DNA mismatch repair endonuclease MutL [Chloroflexota bacterium]